MMRCDDGSLVFFRKLNGDNFSVQLVCALFGVRFVVGTDLCIDLLHWLCCVVEIQQK